MSGGRGQSVQGLVGQGKDFSLYWKRNGTSLRDLREMGDITPFEIPCLPYREWIERSPNRFGVIVTVQMTEHRSPQTCSFLFFFALL